MKYRYLYQSHDNKSCEGIITAKDRNDAYNQLRKQGIKPYKVIGRDPLAWKRWAAIGVLGVAVVALSFLQVAQRPVEETEEPRSQLYGDPATIQQLAVDGWRKTFADAGDAWLARHAIPAATCDCKSVVEDAKQRRSGSEAPLSTLGVSPNATILPISSDDPPELAKMKRMVNGMKSELRDYLAGGGTVEDYMALCDERLSLERGQVALYRQKFDALAKRGGDIESEWERLNAELRDMGLPTRLLPDMDE